MERTLYYASVGPITWNDEDPVSAPSDLFVGMNRVALITDSYVLAAGFGYLDTDGTHFLTINWNEDATANRTLSFILGDGNRTLTVNEDFTIGDGYAGTLTFSAASKTITVSNDVTVPQTLNSIVNPDGDKTFNMTTRQLAFLWTNPAGNPLELRSGGAYTGALLHIHQESGNPGSTYLLDVCAVDTDVEHIKSTGALTTTSVLCAWVTSEAEERFSLKSSGSLNWGDGTNALDTNLYRNAANVLKTDDEFHAAGLTLTGNLVLAANSITGTSVDISNAKLQLLSGITANGGALIGAANYAAMMVLLSGTATGAFSFNSQALTSVGAIGCGAVSGTSTAAFEGASVTIGKASTTTGTLVLHDSNSANTITLTVPDISAGSLTFTLPPTDGDAGNILTTDGDGICTWTSAGAGDVTAAAALTDHLIVRGDVAAKAVQTSGITLDDSDNITDVTSIEVDGAAASPPVANTLYKDNIIKGWVRFDGTGVLSTQDSFNVDSIFDHGAGDYEIDWDTDFVNDGYAIVITPNHFHSMINNTNVAWTRINIFDAAHDPVDTGIVCVIAIGDQ